MTGKILSVEKHPDADHLVVCQLDCAKGRTIDFVTGASNVEVGQIVPVALDGAHVPAKHDAKAPGDLLAAIRRSRWGNSAVSCRMA